MQDETSQTLELSNSQTPDGVEPLGELRRRVRERIMARAKQTREKARQKRKSIMKRFFGTKQERNTENEKNA